MFIELAAKLIGKDVRATVDHDDYTSYDIETDKIVVGGDINEDEYGFLSHLKTAHKVNWVGKLSYATWSFLHEVGHHFTIGNFDDEDLVEGTFSDEPYFDKEVEWVATEWAIEWVKTHPMLARIVDMLIMKSKVRAW